MKASLMNLIGWALALQFAGLYWSERQNHRPMLEGVAAQRSTPSIEGQLDNIRTLLHRHQARQALVESSRTLAQCCSQGVDVPEDLHQLLARSVEAMTPPPPPLSADPSKPPRPRQRPLPQPRAQRPLPSGPRVSLALPECNYPQARPRMPPPPMEPPMMAPPMGPGMSPNTPPEWQFPGQPAGGPHPWPPPAGPPPHPPGW